MESLGNLIYYKLVSFYLNCVSRLIYFNKKLFSYTKKFRNARNVERLESLSAVVSREHIYSNNDYNSWNGIFTTDTFYKSAENILGAPQKTDSGSATYGYKTESVSLLNLHTRALSFYLYSINVINFI